MEAQDLRRFSESGSNLPETRQRGGGSGNGSGVGDGITGADHGSNLTLAGESDLLSNYAG